MQGLGWVKMRGKKSKVLSCGCCVAEDRREDARWQEAANEMRHGEPKEEAVDEYHTREMAVFMPSEPVDEVTLAKYMWGYGLSEARIVAILAQRAADAKRSYYERLIDYAQAKADHLALIADQLDSKAA
jgi:hypothetical protein